MTIETPNEALKTIAMVYAPGTSAYYEKLNPNPWQENMDSLERQIAQPNKFGQPSYTRFVERAKSLIEDFRKAGSIPKEFTPADGYAMGPAGIPHVEAAMARVYRRCRVCDTDKELGMYKISPNVKTVELLCLACATAQGKVKRQ